VFSGSRDPRGGYAPLMAAIAFLVLAAFAAGSGVLGSATVWLVVALLFGCGGSLGVWIQRKRAGRYDLNRLWDAPPPEPEEPLYDTLPPDELAAPYCGWCDEACAPNAYRCHRCGRELT
jgi:hypothetical protein